MIKIIIFDLEKVLVPTWREVFDLPELNISKCVISEFFDDHNDLRKEMQYGRLTEDGFWKQFIHFTEANVTVDELKEGVRKVLKIYPEVLEISNYLHRKYKLVISSNFTREWADYLIEEYKLNEIFDDMFWSFNNGIKKPSPEAYLQITQKFNVRPEECLFIDDKERNTEGAKKVGMRTILYTNLEKLKRELSDTQIKI